METTAPKFELGNIVKAVDELLPKTDNPRHRAMLKNYRRHALLEVSGRWREILVPEMIVDHPVYRINEMGQSLVLDGMQAVADFYKRIAEEVTSVFGPVEQNVAVADWGLAFESLWARPVPGHVLRSLGEVVDDPQGWYQVTGFSASFWPYDKDCRLIGEHIYQDGNQRITRMDPADVVSIEEARRVLTPLLDHAPG